MPDNAKIISERLAVCSWSLQPVGPLDLAEKLTATGIKRVQLELGPLVQSPAIWGGTADIFQTHGIEIVSGMCRCVGENYATLETIRLTGGIAPDAKKAIIAWPTSEWQERW